jgi:excisionase family DNA binding protein
MANSEYWLTVDEAASHLHVSTKTVYKWIKNGLLRAHRLGPRRIAISIDDLDDLYRPFGKSYRRHY